MMQSQKDSEGSCGVEEVNEMDFTHENVYLLYFKRHDGKL